MYIYIYIYIYNILAPIMAADGGSFPAALPCAFSPRARQYLALCAQDGRLRIWSTDSRALHQEYVPSAHLSATCTCVAWGPCRATKEGPQRKKRKFDTGHVAEQTDLLALGTASGTVLIYSMVKGDLHCTLDGGHNDGVNCVQWHPEDSLFYSGSDDTHIVEWDLQTGRTRCKWKADRAAVTSLCVSPDGKLLLSAGRSIKMWDLATKEVYRKFTGHCTTVTNLCFATTRPPDSDALYFLSGASHDRLLSVWQVRSDGRDKDSVVSFTLTDEPRHVDLQTSNSKDEAVRLAVVCKDGQLHIFEHFLNGPCKKPLSPVCSLQVSTLRSGDTPLPVPLLTASLCADRQRLLLAYGSHLQPVLETTPINMSERHVCLIRDLNTAHSLSVDTAVSKVKTPIVNDQKSKVLMPGLPGHQAPIRAAPSQSEKRKKGAGTKEMSIEERLEQIELGASGTGGGGERVSTSLQTDGYAVLLVQALESRDAKMMNKILQTKKEYVIRNTIWCADSLSLSLPLSRYRAILIVPWLKAVLTQHTSYLSSLPDLVAQLGTLYHAIESRVKVYQQLTRLHGKLYLLMTQVATSKRSQRVEDLDHTARLVYEEGRKS
uniref:WD repeat domain 43 n=1 Tax=Electrophorus electricus TaxID=8005 RepID=A0A4W4H0T5_ELEEL